jgi:hypothetical protein
MKKKIISLIAILAMSIGMLPTTIFAEPPGQICNAVKDLISEV